ncbi:hypothetical protein [Ideonella livida]|uniref:Tetratricopeptide repeat protein n=1 Tax=Ideonella livida TaxID=2707176 RepID=A0A7C9TK31_9BURK|nr:hypothetical protein [Ideonella livida]NDY92421.1 hypothetical protein [Ideonella livida]
MNKILHTLAAATLALAVHTAQAQALRPEVGKPLQAAGELLKAGKAKEALAKVKEADGAANKTAAEQLMIDRMRGAAAQRAGDNATAIQAFESAMASGKLAPAEQAQVAESLAFAYSQTKDLAKAGQWAAKAQALGSTSPQLKQLQSYLQAQSGDYAAVAKEAAAAITAAEQAGKRPEEADLLRLADAYQRTQNAAGQSAALEKLLAHYPKKEYWKAVLERLPRKPGFSDRFALDVMRLKLASGNLSKPDEYMEMAQLSLQAGLPAEALAITEKGFAAGVLGSGPEAARHQRLKDLAVKKDAETRAGLDKLVADAKDPNALLQAGMVLTSVGQADRGQALIEQALAKPAALKRPEDAKLRLGLALVQGGKTKARGLQVLRSVQGSDGVADIARLYALQGNS